MIEPKFNHIFISLTNVNKDILSFMTKNYLDFYGKPSVIKSEERLLVSQKYFYFMRNMVNIDHFLVSFKKAS